MSGWALAKYGLALAGLALVLLGDRVNRAPVSYAGLGLIVTAFVLRFVERARERRTY